MTEHQRLLFLAVLATVAAFAVTGCQHAVVGRPETASVVANTNAPPTLHVGSTDAATSAANGPAVGSPSPSAPDAAPAVGAPIATRSPAQPVISPAPQPVVVPVVVITTPVAAPGQDAAPRHQADPVAPATSKLPLALANNLDGSTPATKAIASGVHCDKVGKKARALDGETMVCEQASNGQYMWLSAELQNAAVARTSVAPPTTKAAAGDQ